MLDLEDEPVGPWLAGRPGLELYQIQRPLRERSQHAQKRTRLFLGPHAQQRTGARAAGELETRSAEHQKACLVVFAILHIGLEDLEPVVRRGEAAGDRAARDVPSPRYIER